MKVDPENQDSVMIKQKLIQAVNNEPMIVAVTGHIGKAYEQKAI